MLLKTFCYAGAVLTAITFGAPRAHAVARFWLSTTGSPSVVSVGEVPTILHSAPDTTGTLYIWGRPEREESSGESKTLEGWSLRVVSTNSTVVALTTANVATFNSDMAAGTPDVRRWQSTYAPTGTVVGQTSVLADIRGLFVPVPGSTPVGVGIGKHSATAPSYTDPNYSSTQDAWLLAQFTYSLPTGPAAQPGRSEIYLQIGELGMNHLEDVSLFPNPPNSSLTNVIFGAGTGPTLNALNDRMRDTPKNNPGAQFTADAIIEFGKPNFDGDVDIDGFDFLRWQRGFGKTGNATLADGDATGDFSVNAADLAHWRNRFGTVLPGAAAVPEPFGLAMALAVGVQGIIAVRRFPQGRCRKSPSS
jgi:hypothetical protein